MCPCHATVNDDGIASIALLPQMRMYPEVKVLSAGICMVVRRALWWMLMATHVLHEVVPAMVRSRGKFNKLSRSLPLMTTWAPMRVISRMEIVVMTL